ncbi:MAG: hypothetical protein IME93_04320 [Proteobacteria bacterium]|nr:hypothetical protein [Pseudomonadota bacterium]
MRFAWPKRPCTWPVSGQRSRGGWSGVSRVDIKDTDGNSHGIFIKRQENHTYKSLSHPLGELMFVREFHNINVYHKANVPTLDVIYFATRLEPITVIARRF